MSVFEMIDWNKMNKNFPSKNKNGIISSEYIRDRPSTITVSILATVLVPIPKYKKKYLLFLLHVYIYIYEKCCL